MKTLNCYASGDGMLSFTWSQDIRNRRTGQMEHLAVIDPVTLEQARSVVPHGWRVEIVAGQIRGVLEVDASWEVGQLMGGN